jgi:hypothetical protein
VIEIGQRFIARANGEPLGHRAVAETGELGKMNHIQWLCFDPGAVLRELAG